MRIEYVVNSPHLTLVLKTNGTLIKTPSFDRISNTSPFCSKYRGTSAVKWSILDNTESAPLQVRHCMVLHTNVRISVMWLTLPSYRNRSRENIKKVADSCAMWDAGALLSCGCFLKLPCWTQRAHTGRDVSESTHVNNSWDEHMQLPSQVEWPSPSARGTVCLKRQMLEVTYLKLPPGVWVLW